MLTTWRITLCLLSTLALAGGCGGAAAPSGGGASSTPIPLEISFAGTPEGATPVGVIAGNLAVDLLLTKAATTGLKLGSISETTFASTESYMGCQATTQLIFGYDPVSEGDFKLCTIKKILASQGLTTSDVDDTTLTYAITGNDDMDLVQLSITADASTGGVTGYTFHSCLTAGSERVQGSYHQYALSGSDATLNSVTRQSDGGNTGHLRTTVSGPINSNGVFTNDKTIVSALNSTSTSGDTTYFEGTLVQSGTQFFHTGATNETLATGEVCDSGQTETGSTREVFYAQLLEYNTSSDLDTYSLANLAIGDGAGIGNTTITCDGTAFTSIAHNESWDGDTRGEVASNDFTASAQAATLPTTPTVASTTFTGDEILDCDAAAASATATIAASTIDCANRDSIAFDALPGCNELEGANGLTIFVEDAQGWSGGTTPETANTVGINDTLTLTFNRAVKVSSLSDNVILTNTTTSQTVSLGTPTMNTAGTEASYALSLTNGNTYTLEITAGASGVVSDPSENPLASYDGTPLTGDLTLYIVGSSS